MEALLGSFVSETFARSSIELPGDGVALVLIKLGHAHALWDVLSDQSVSVLVGATLPRVVRGGEVERNSSCTLDGFVAMELGAIVRGDRLESIEVLADEADRACAGLFLRSGPELTDEHVTTLAFDEADDAVLAARPHDGVDFPVAQLSSRLDAGGPFTDVPLAGEPATAVIGTVALAPSLSGAAQLGVKRAAALEILPDVAIDGFMTDAEFALPAQEAGDLFRTPLLAQQSLDASELLRTELLITSRSRSSATGHEDGFGGSIVSRASTIALELATDGAAMSLQILGDLRLIQTLLAQRRNHIPLLRGELAITHDDSPCLAGFEESPLSQFTSLPGRSRVALSL